MSPYPKRRFDLYDVEHFVVRTRNRLQTLMESKGDFEAKKVFILGHARTGTMSFHHAIRDLGVASRHTAGHWHLGQFDSFSDRGDYRPLDLYRKWYPNSRYILNCRPLGPWIYSTLRRRNRHHSDKHVVNMILRRNKFFADTVNLFQSDDRLIIVDITQPESLSFALSAAGFPEAQANPHSNKGPKDAVVKSVDAYERIKDGPLGTFFDRPFIIPELLEADEHPYSGWQDATINNLA